MVVSFPNPSPEAHSRLERRGMTGNALPEQQRIKLSLMSLLAHSCMVIISATYVYTGHGQNE